MNKNSKKKLDFLPNKLNKYSIRRFTVGTASILVGATLIFGVANDQAEAAENNTTQKQDDSSDASKVKGNVQTIEQSSANSNESDIPEQVDVTKDTTEQASTEEKQIQLNKHQQKKKQIQLNKHQQKKKQIQLNKHQQKKSRYN